ncbi:hypothetical protein [Acaricomes phytoseiuli]|uniref:hypothetical protein n=1 Tax=Acaricomes phytoseiuli TaxID=291968 RepID=UPI0012EA39C3|nr:hypothetical protein [Acaricomes phytoseiuli]
MGASAPQFVSLVGALSLLLLFFVGMVRGPALREPFQTYVLAGSNIARSVSMFTPFLFSALILTGLFDGVAVFFASVFVLSGSTTLAAVVPFVLAAICWGVIGSWFWLLGQTSIGFWRLLLPMLLAAGSILSWVFTGANNYLPWGWLGQVWPVAGGSEMWGLILLTLLSGMLAFSTPFLLGRLKFEGLLEQSERWQAAGISTSAGEFSTALAVFRAKPRFGRRLPAVLPVPTPWRFLVRDGLGALRTPVRFLVGTAALAAGVGLIFFAASSSGPVAWLPAGAGSVLAYFGLGVFCDGFRHAAEATAAPTIYGYPPLRLYLFHSIFPITWSLATLAVVGIAMSVSGVTTISLGAWIAGVMILAILSGVRVYDSARGPLPPVLLTPIPTPFGDLSSLVVLAWQADAILISASLGASIIGVMSTGMLLPSIFLALLSLAALGWLTQRRLVRL